MLAAHGKTNATDLAKGDCTISEAYLDRVEEIINYALNADMYVIVNDHWGGDCWSNYESMEESLRGGLSLTSSGFGFWSHDIGGFEATSTPDVYKRWCAFGLLSTHSRLHLIPGALGL